MGEIQRVDIHKKLSESEKLIKEVSQTWEEKLMKTERIQNERQQALEKMGISIQASGIKVEKNKYYLVNLNADPSLNELLVYYLKVSVKFTHSKCLASFSFRKGQWWVLRVTEEVVNPTSNCPVWAFNRNTASSPLKMVVSSWNH